MYSQRELQQLGFCSKLTKSWLWLRCTVEQERAIYIRILRKSSIETMSRMNAKDGCGHVITSS